MTSHSKSISLRADQLKFLEESGLNISEIVQDALDQWIRDRSQKTLDDLKERIELLQYKRMALQTITHGDWETEIKPVSDEIDRLNEKVNLVKANIEEHNEAVQEAERARIEKKQRSGPM